MTNPAWDLLGVVVICAIDVEGAEKTVCDSSAVAGSEIETVEPDPPPQALSATKTKPPAASRQPPAASRQPPNMRQIDRESSEFLLQGAVVACASSE
jgi:ribosome-binding protein aMBF1 (putative translation factor)